MWLSPEDARSDIVLAVAGLVLGGMLVELLYRWLGVIGVPVVGDVLFPVLVLLVTGYPAWWLVRYRGQGMEGHGLPGDGRGSLARGVVLALPVLAAGYVAALRGSGPVAALLGRLAPTLSGVGTDTGEGTTVLGSAVGVDLLSLLLGILTLLAAGVGAVLLHGLVAERSGQAFRSDEMPVLEALRTYGVGAVGVAAVLGLLTVLRGDRDLLGLGLEVLPLLVVVLLTDRLLLTKDRTTRAGALAPLVVVAVIEVFGFGGGFFGGDLLGSLYQAALGGGLAVVVTTLVATRRHAWAWVPLVAATVWAPLGVVLPTLARLG